MRPSPWLSAALATSATAMASAVVAQADPSNPLIGMVLVRGECGLELMTYGKAVANPSCKPLINTVYRNGRTGFYFTTDEALMTFSGIQPQINQGPDDIIQPVDLILVTKTTNDEPGQPEALPASGRCSFSNPFRGIATTVQCEAETSAGRFSATFHHDGSEPSMLLEDGSESNGSGEPSNP